MNKILIRGVIVIGLFFALFLGFSQVDWITLFKVEKATASTEEKLGDLMWDLFSKGEHEVLDKNITSPVDSLLTRICTANDIDRSQIKLHIIESGEVNAFAFPNKHLVVYTGLISACENESELAGVLGHETGHIEMNHVMKKLVKEVGLSLLISMTTGKAGSDKVQQVARTLSSSAYDRTLEKEADIKSVDYMIQAKIDPTPFADFLFKLAGGDENLDIDLSWISTHPDSKERAEYIVEYSLNKPQNAQPVLSQATWDKLKEDVEGLE